MYLQSTSKPSAGASASGVSSSSLSPILRLIVANWPSIIAAVFDFWSSFITNTKTLHSPGTKSGSSVTVPLQPLGKSTETPFSRLVYVPLTSFGIILSMSS